ncbi:hypothetical protein EYF80_057027 [Liparis tanakae]|uniref:Uncharacterized protein n=1 Tax=Liparis tanakae TaxID=230148 RepID=A0A4Z2EVE0_9TELE|nr:hypothetical protein EYF80_057027 [Liparis tanakae]
MDGNVNVRLRLTVWLAAHPAVGRLFVQSRRAFVSESGCSLFQMCAGSPAFSPSGTKDNQSIRSIFFSSSTFRRDNYCLQGFLHLRSSLHPKSIPSPRCVSLAFSPEAKQK